MKIVVTLKALKSKKKKQSQTTLSPNKFDIRIMKICKMVTLIFSREHVLVW